MTAAAAPEQWAIVELMGHRQRAGRMAEVEMFGSKLLRIDIPTDEAEVFVTEFYGGSAIYALRPATEEIAREFARRQGDPRPVAPVSFRLPAPEATEADGLELDDLDDDGPY